MSWLVTARQFDKNSLLLTREGGTSCDVGISVFDAISAFSSFFLPLAYGSASTSSSVAASLNWSGMIPVLASATIRQSVSHCDVTENNDGQGRDDQDELLSQVGGLNTNGDSRMSSDVSPDVTEDGGDGDASLFVNTAACK